MVTAIRLGVLALGVSCAGLGAFGAYEFAHKLEGGITYLVLERFRPNMGQAS